MKKALFLAAATIALASCSSDELVNKSAANEETPIAFSVEKKNITRGTQNLEATGHYNFGVWAYKYKDGLTTQQVMGNYLVGYSDGNGTGYDNTNATTWSDDAGTLNDHSDHQSPWFYEYLGTDEYTYDGTAGYYTKDQKAYMSANANQYLRYWDLAYATTNFYAYAPYRSAGVDFDESAQTITVDHTAQVAGYDDASLDEFMYAGAAATNKDMQDVTLQFKHLGAQVNLRFYESVRGYKVEIIDVTTNGSGIQATPATKSGTTYSDADYYTECGATIDYSTVTDPKPTVDHTDAATTQENLKFLIPGRENGTNGVKKYISKSNNTYYVIPDSVDTDQTYAVSPTKYYPVAQPTDREVGFTFHVSYKLIAEDNGEEITVNDARVYVPAYTGSDPNKIYIAAWQPNTKYTYTFKITKNSTGSTDPTYPDVDDPTVPAKPTVYPIVFDGATIEDYTENVANY